MRITKDIDKLKTFNFDNMSMFLRNKLLSIDKVSNVARNTSIIFLLWMFIASIELTVSECRLTDIVLPVRCV